MFESIELRQAKNGFIIILNSEGEETKEYVFDTPRRVVKFIKDHVDLKKTAETV